MSLTISQKEIENRILLMRGVQVMIDMDIAEMYQVETKRLNEQVKRNIERFPELFMFQLSENEKNELVANCDRFKKLKHSSYKPYAFTEQGVAMLSSVLRSDIAIKVSIQIMQAFVQMRHHIQQNASLFHRINKLELKQLENDQKFEQVFKALEKGTPKPDKGIFFNGQIFDAYAFVSDLIREAEKEIILVDNYIDDSVLTHFAKRKQGVHLIIYTKKITNQLKLDTKKHHAQYAPVSLNTFSQSHDRFLIIDKKELYHIGASLKDLGEKWFPFSRMDGFTEQVLKQLKDD